MEERQESLSLNTTVRFDAQPTHAINALQVSQARPSLDADTLDSANSIRHSGQGGPSFNPITEQGPPVLHNTETGPAYFSNARDFNVHNAEFGTTHNHYHPTKPLGKAFTVVYFHDAYVLVDIRLLLAKSAPAAAFNSIARFDAPQCDADTRTGLIEEIIQWCYGTPSLSLLCLTGSAGSGKSALAQTISQICAQRKVLAASFFFSAADSSRNHPGRFVASLAVQIAQAVDFLRSPILQAFADDPSIFHKSLDLQVESLLVQPLCSHLQSPSQALVPAIIVIDGLDECLGEDSQVQVVSALQLLTRSGLPFRVFLTSRPEVTIRDALAPSGILNDIAYHIVLNNHNATEDIRTTLRRRLREVGKKFLHDSNWPSERDIECLVSAASGQFIHAATVIKFLSERRASPKKRLQVILGGDIERSRVVGQNPFKPIDTLYSTILRTAKEAYDGTLGDDEPSDFVLRLQCLRFLSTASRFDHRRARYCAVIDAFLQWEDGDTVRFLEDLHSVFNLRKDNDEKELYLSIHHRSFSEYLASEARCGVFYCPWEELYQELALCELLNLRGVTSDGEPPSLTEEAGLSDPEAHDG